MSEPAVTIVIPTYGAAPHLGMVLHGLSIQTVRDFEVVVVDNNRRQRLRASLLATFRLAGRVIHEPCNGLQVARNAGVSHARGVYIAFLDDDAVPIAPWLQHLLDGMTRYGSMAAGGSVFLALTSGAPAWLGSDARALLSELIYAGEDIARLDEDRYIVGANMCILRSAFKTVGMFDPEFDRTASSLRSSGDLEFTRRLQACGNPIAFIAGARVDHKIGGDRLTEEYLLRRSYWQGRSDALLEAKWGRPTTFGKRDWLRNLGALNRSFWGMIGARSRASGVAQRLSFVRECGYTLQVALLRIRQIHS